MFKLSSALFFIAALSFMPFALNLRGTSLFLYINLGSKDLVFGASEGVSHNALADAFEDEDTLAAEIIEPYLDACGFEYHAYTLGPLTLHTENGSGFRPYRFSLSPDPDYAALEFPWLLIPGLLFALAFGSHFKTKAKPQESEGSK
eukprot:g15350.t1